VTDQPSGKLYTAVTKYWPRIAAGFVVALGVVELVLGGITADSSLEFYLTAWAASTGGLWFLFEKAEKALSEESRKGVVAWLGTTDIRTVIESIPVRFVSLFDRIFGEKHLSVRCFARSAVASAFAVAVVGAVRASTGDELATELGEEPLMTFVGLTVFSIATNVMPDYISLLQSRWTIAWAAKGGRIIVPLLADLILTSFVSAGWILVMAFIVDGTPPAAQIQDIIGGGLSSIWFYSGFFTSVWLWLYMLAVPASRILLRMNNGVGFLLRVTDVEKQPFRSMGFVSVIIVSALFALGLPLVLL